MKRYKKAFSIENKISSFNIATAKQKTVICDILIGVRENFRNFVISSATKSESIQNSFSCFWYTNWPYFRLVETLWIPNNSIKILGCPYAFTMYNVTPMERQISVEVNEKHSFETPETYASLCQLQITLPESLVSNNLSTHAKKWFSDFKQKSSVSRVSVLSVKLFCLYCLFELNYCDYGLGLLNFRTEISFAWVSINYMHVYTVSFQNKMAPKIDRLPTRRLISVLLAWLSMFDFQLVFGELSTSEHQLKSVKANFITVSLNCTKITVTSVENIFCRSKYWYFFSILSSWFDNSFWGGKILLFYQFTLLKPTGFRIFNI